jgi:hypothetical protein
MQRIVHDEPRSLREQDANTPTWLEEFVFRLLAKEKSARFTSADEVVTILESELAYQQSPHADTEPARPWKRVHTVPKPTLPQRRRRPATMVAAALAVIGGVWLAYTRSPGLEGTEEHSRAHVPTSLDAPTVPSWDSDGMRHIQAAARSLEERARQTAIESDFDPWQHEANEIRQRLANAAATQDLWVLEPR